MNQEKTIGESKRFRGRKGEDPVVQEASKRVPYRVSRAANTQPAAPAPTIT